MINTATRLKLLRIFNFSLKKGKFPQMWKEALIIPIHKKGKDKTNSSSYRSIKTNQFDMKTMERIVNLQDLRLGKSYPKNKRVSDNSDQMRIM